MKLSTVPVYYVAMIIDSLAAKGWDRNKLIQKLNCPPDLLLEKRARIPSSDFAQCAGYLATKLQDESLGMLVSPMKIGTFALLCQSSINCDTLGHFLRRYSKSMGIANESVKLVLSSDAELATYSVKCDVSNSYTENTLVMMILAIAHRLSSWAIDQKIVLHDVNIVGKAPFFARDYNMLFMSRVNFEQKENSIRFSVDYLDAKVMQDELALRKFLAQSALPLMSELELDSSLTSQISHLIRANVSGEFPNFVDLAKSMNYTSATLRRRLRVEGSTYQDIKDAVRRDTAIHYLSRNSMSLEEVAEKSGFTEPTSFFRAFKRWTGTSPRAYVSEV